jgi:hypothetical protein
VGKDNKTFPAVLTRVTFSIRTAEKVLALGSSVNRPPSDMHQGSQGGIMAAGKASRTRMAAGRTTVCLL